MTRPPVVCDVTESPLDTSRLEGVPYSEALILPALDKEVFLRARSSLLADDLRVADTLARLPKSAGLDFFEPTLATDCFSQVDQVLSILLEGCLPDIIVKMEPRSGLSACQVDQTNLQLLQQQSLLFHSDLDLQWQQQQRSFEQHFLKYSAALLPGKPLGGGGVGCGSLESPFRCLREHIDVLRAGTPEGFLPSDSRIVACENEGAQSFCASTAYGGYINSPTAVLNELLVDGFLLGPAHEGVLDALRL